jgi:putative peptide zinc metalloprotease protein
LGIAEYCFLLELESAPTIDEAWQTFDHKQQMGTADGHRKLLTRQQAEAICHWLVNRGLVIESDVRSQPKQASQPAWSAFNPFFFTRSLFNPDRLLDRLSPLRLMFTWPFYAVLTCFASIALCLIWSRAGQFVASYNDMFVAHRAASLIVFWVLLKKLRHGIVCRRYGGRVPDTGMAFILLTPIAYIDVTSSWRFASRWQRIHVAMAGVVVEWLIATIAAFVWIFAESALVKQCAADLIVMATVSSLLFNMNPLMRFDGYFVLADLLGIDNLYQSGRECARYWCQRYLLGLPTTCPRLPSERPAVVKVYGLTAACWRVVIIYGLLVAAAAIFHGAGIVIAAFGIAIWIIAPTTRLARDMIQAASSDNFPIKHVLGRTVLVTAMGATILFLIPIEFSRTVPGIVEYDPPTIVRAGSDGFAERIYVQNGQTVRRGDPIITLRNEQLKLQLSAVQTSLELAEHRARSGQWNHDSSEVNQSQSEAEGLRQQRQELLQRIDQLTVCASSDGRVISRRLEESDGTYLAEGDEIASIGLEHSKRLKVSMHQRDINDLKVDLNSAVRVWTSSATWRAAFTRIDPRTTRQLPHESLCSTGGGGLTVQRDESGDLLLTEPRVNAYITLNRQTSFRLFAGQRATVTLGASSRSLGDWLVRCL